MACDIDALVSDSRCLGRLPAHQLLAAWAWVVCNGGPTPPTDDTRITEEDAIRITEEGETRILED